uniref:NADH-ubiquinone oxidoreductase chain 4 n=1 Tax=Thyasira tokunagai TaxID=3055801 RepID=A0AB39CCE2_9BIVA
MMYGVMAGGLMCILVSLSLNSFLLWSSLLVGVGILFSLSISLVNTQMSGIVCNSMEFISGSFSEVMVLLTMWVYMLSLMVSDKMSVEGPQSSYFTVLGLLALICSIFFSVSDFFFMYLFFEGALIPIIFMILGWGRQPERFEAGLYMLVYTIMGSLPLLLGLLWLWGVNTSSFFLLQVHPGGYFEGSLAIMTISLAFCIKMPIFSVHGWLPKAHVEAPVAGSMMLAGVLLKMGVYGLLMFYWAMEVNYIWLFEAISIISLIGGVISGLMCLYQSDTKALIAYSSVAHMCFLMVGLMSLGWVGWEGVILMALSHGICSPWLFFLANYLSEMGGTRSLYLLKGVLLVSPLLMLSLFLGVCSNMAIPPCVALVAELSLFMSGVFFSFSMAVPMMLLCFFAAVYSLNLYSMVSHGSISTGMKLESGMNSRCALGSMMAGLPLWLGIFMLDIFSLN